MRYERRRLRQALLPLGSVILLGVTLLATGVQASSEDVDSARETSGPEAAIVRGIASWYDDGPGLYAAVPSFRWGDDNYNLVVTSGDRTVVVRVRDHCNCYVGTERERVIDLSPEAFARLAPLSVGLIKVTYMRTDAIKLPETDTE